MPPATSFHPGPTPIQAEASPAVEVDLAGDRRPRCRVELTQQSQPGTWLGSCACGFAFAVVVLGREGDTLRLLAPCFDAPKSVPAEQRRLL